MLRERLAPLPPAPRRREGGRGGPRRNPRDVLNGALWIPLCAADRKQRTLDVAKAVAQSTARVYTGDSRAAEPVLRDVLAALRHGSEALQIDDLARFGGEGNPGDQAVVLVLGDPESETCRTDVAPFGEGRDRLDAKVVLRLGGPRPREGRVAARSS